MDPINKVYDVAIIGSGTLSQVCAALSQCYGLDTALIKNYEDTKVDYDSLMLDDETMRLLNSIGILEQIKSHIYSPYFTDLILPSGKVIQRNLVSKTNNGYFQINFINQNLLRRSLTQKINEAPGLCILEKSELINFDYIDDIYELNLKIDKKLSFLKAKHLVVCEEVQSIINKFPTSINDLKYNKDWLITDITTDKNDILESAFRQVCDPQRPTTQIVTSENTCRFEFQLLAGENKDYFSNSETVKKLLEPFLGDNEYFINNFFIKNFKGYYCNKIKFGRVFLAGDAAHKIPPFAGHNFNAGIRDIINIIWKLSLHCNNNIFESIIDTYESERLIQIKETIKSSIALGQLIDSMSIAYQKDISFEESIPPEAREQAFGDKSIAAQSWISNGLYHSDLDDSLLTKRIPKIKLKKDGVEYEIDDILDFNFAIITKHAFDEKLLILKLQPAKKLKIKVINLSDYVYKNDFLRDLLDDGDILVRPDKKIFGISSLDLPIDKLLDDLLSQLSK